MCTALAEWSTQCNGHFYQLCYELCATGKTFCRPQTVKEIYFFSIWISMYLPIYTYIWSGDVNFASGTPQQSIFFCFIHFLPCLDMRQKNNNNNNVFILIVAYIYYSYFATGYTRSLLKNFPIAQTVFTLCIGQCVKKQLKVNYYW